MVDALRAIYLLRFVTSRSGTIELDGCHPFALLAVGITPAIGFDDAEEED